MGTTPNDNSADPMRFAPKVSETSKIRVTRASRYSFSITNSAE